jgi:hypothetical protein
LKIYGILSILFFVLAVFREDAKIAVSSPASFSNGSTRLFFNLQSSIFNSYPSKLFEFFYKHANFFGKRRSFRSGYPLQPQTALIDPQQSE